MRRLASQLHPGRFQVHYLHNATLGRRNFYRQLCWGLGLTPSATAAALFCAVSQHIEELDGMPLDAMLDTAATGEGLFADHLRHLLWHVQGHPELREATVRVMGRRASPIRLDTEIAFKLVSIGIMHSMATRYAQPANLSPLFHWMPAGA